MEVVAQAVEHALHLGLRQVRIALLHLALERRMEAVARDAGQPSLALAPPHQPGASGQQRHEQQQIKAHESPFLVSVSRQVRPAAGMGGWRGI
ncbi:hypothetical protein D3C78_1670740 [compost metagenome]